MSIPVCKFYSHNRNCKFGINCRFLHCDTLKPFPNSQSTDYDNGSVNQDIQSPLNTFPTTPSYYFESTKEQDGTVNGNQSQSTSSSIPELYLLESNHENENSVKRNWYKPVNSSNYQDRKPCRFYAENGYCAFGRNCRFEHGSNLENPGFSGSRYSYHGGPRNYRTTKPEVAPRFKKYAEPHGLRDVKSEDNIQPQIVENEPEVHILSSASTQNEKQLPRHKRCLYFERGRCFKGRNCTFLHVSKPKIPEVTNQENADKKPDNEEEKPVKEIQQPIGAAKFDLNQANEELLRELRDTEIGIIKKRFPSDKMEILDEESKFSVKVSFLPTDPDWPFDIKVFNLVLDLPVMYPKDPMSVSVPNDQEQDIPETLRRFVELSISEWMDEKYSELKSENKSQLLFRPFLRWIDRNIEDVVTDGLKQLKRELVARAAGMTFIPAEQLQAKFRDSKITDSDENSNVENETDSEYETESDDDESDDTEEDDDVNLDPDKKGTEVALRHFQMKENAAAILFEKLMLTVQCLKCKNHSDILVPQQKVLSVTCEKCSNGQFVSFRPSLLHQFSSVIGYLDLDGCRAFDLIFQDCVAQVTCLACNKQTKIDGFVSGQMIDGWCQACNARFKFATEAVRFSELVPSVINTSNKSEVISVTSKKKKPPKDPAIKEGQPLPDFGACRHYKQSYRWLRFPCCGKAYPCDVCHDKKEDHEMLMATRMICGHCCREQNFSASRPCTACNQHMTKVHSAHWEGGKGCRDRIAMSRSDNQKYKNQTKTVSNHKKKVQTGSKKKTTKLRRS